MQHGARMTESLLPDELVVPQGDVEPVSWTRRRLNRLSVDEATVVGEAGRAALIWFTLVVVYTSQRSLSLAALLGLTVAAAIWLVTLRSAAMPGRVVLGRAVEASVGTAGGLVIVAALNSSPFGLHASFPLLLGSAVAVFCSATVWAGVLDFTTVAKRRVLLVGAESVETLLAKEIGASRRPQFDFVGAVPGADELAQIVDAQRPDIVVLTDEATYGVALERLLDARSKVRVAGIESFFECAFGRVPIDQIGPAWFMSLLHPRQRIYKRFTKRTFDVAVAVFGLVLAAPLMAVIALAAKATGGPVLYHQTRLGEDGRPFTVYKFRTMSCDAERDGAAFACSDDSRTTRLGRFLRRTHLDELPQLWNVVRDEMSIVGPRPERPEFIEMIEKSVPFWNRRLLVKPGVTGWAQVRTGYAADCEAMKLKLSYDLWYIRHRSLLVDLAICVRTFLVLLGRPVRSE
jgi:exopolysaccharide biosynthesis polyprenyl glycosylphosphotransferase